MERIILVLGGGGVKGVAHVGVWRALMEAGVEVAEIIGTSIGALVAASIAGGSSPDELEERARSLTRKDIVDINRWALMPMGIRQASLARGEALRAYIGRVLPEHDWDELTIPLAVNAVDLGSGSTVWFGAGGRRDLSVADAVYASSALPAFYPPLSHDGMHLVDGGVLDTLPITRASDRGADRIIAVNTSAGRTKAADDTIDKGMLAIYHRVMDITAYARRRAVEDGWFGPPVLHIRPDVASYSTFDFDAVDYFIAEGYRAATAALETL